jgi:hypothetical protein
MDDEPLSDAELIAGGVASVLLLGLGVYLVTKATQTATTPTDSLEDTTALATIATVV